MIDQNSKALVYTLENHKIKWNFNTLSRIAT